jgi:hypothetical protein
MNSRKAPCNHRHASEKSRLQGGVLAAGAFAVVPVADDAPSYARVPVLFRDFGDCINDAREGVEGVSADRVAAVEGLCAGEQIAGDIL